MRSSILCDSSPKLKSKSHRLFHVVFEKGFNEAVMREPSDARQIPPCGVDQALIRESSEVAKRSGAV